MTTIYKLCLGVGLLATGGEVVTHGDEHAAKIKEMTRSMRLDKRPDKGIQEIPLSEFNHLPFGIQRTQE